MNLDTPTLFTTVTIAYFSGALVMGLLAAFLRNLPRQYRLGWSLWAAALMLSGTGAIMVGMRGTISDLYSIAISNALILFGFGLRANALSLLTRQEVAYRWLPFVATFGWLALYTVPWFRESLSARVIYIQSFCILSSFLCIAQCLRLDRGKILVSWFLVLVFCADVMLRLSFIGITLKMQYPTFQASFTTPPLNMLLIGLLVTVILKVVGLGVTVFEQMKGQYQEQALTDPLTGLPNRRAFRALVLKRLSEKKRPAGDYALVTLEIDKLDDLNARFGHSMSDAYLRLLGRLCQEAISSREAVGYLRHNQIALFLSDTTATAVQAMVRRISRDMLVESDRASSQRMAVTVSAGVFCGPTTVPGERALEVADYCQAVAKRKGGNKVVTNEGGNDGPLTTATVNSPFATRKQSVA